MTEKEIKSLGFEMQESNDYPAFHYYYYEIVNGLGLISSANTDVENDDWYVDIFNTEPTIRFHKMEQVQSFINTLEKLKVS